MFTLDRFVV